MGVPYPVILAVADGPKFGGISQGAFAFYCAIAAHRKGMTAEIGDREAALWAHIDRNNIPRYIDELTRALPGWFAVVRRDSGDRPEHPGWRSKYLAPYARSDKDSVDSGSSRTATVDKSGVDNAASENEWRSQDGHSGGSRTASQWVGEYTPLPPVAGGLESNPTPTLPVDRGGGRRAGHGDAAAPPQPSPTSGEGAGHRAAARTARKGVTGAKTLQDAFAEIRRRTEAMTSPDTGAG